MSNATAAHKFSPADIALVAGTSVLKVVIGGGFSAFAFRYLSKRGDISDGFIKQVALLNKKLFLPCFIFANCAQGLTGDLVASLLFLPILAALYVLGGALAGFVGATLSCTPRSQWPVFITMTTFSNVVGMPLPLCLSIIEGVPSLRDSPDAEARAPSYLFLVNIVQSSLMWSLAGRVLALGAPDASSGRMLSTSSRSDMPVVEMTVQQERTAPVGDGMASAAAEGDAATAPATTATRRAKSVAIGCYNVLNNAPTMASLLGCACGVIGPLRPVFIDLDAPLRFIIDGMLLIGKGAVPLVIFVLGANMSKGSTGNAGLLRMRTIAGVLITKLIVVPVIALGTLQLSLALKLIPADPTGLLPLLLIVVGASPTAMNTSTIATIQGAGQREVSVLLFWLYILAPISVSFWSSIGMVCFLPPQ